MALGETQALLARLFTDGALRRRFFEAPVEVAMQSGLDEREARLLAAIDVAEVEAFAWSLLGKRALDLRKSMPLTAHALGGKFDAVLTDAQTRDTSRARSDAGMLAHYLDALATTDDAFGYVADVARFELAFIEAARPGLWAKRFRYDLSPLVSALRAGVPVEARRRLTIGIWARAPGANLRWSLVGLPFQARR